MTIKGILLSSTAIVKRFQTEKSTRETGSPSRRMLQPYTVLENHSGGATRPRKKVWCYLYPFRYNTSVWQTDTLLRQRPPYAMHHAVKTHSRLIEKDSVVEVFVENLAV